MKASRRTGSAPTKKIEKNKRSSRDKKKQLTLTNDWLDENYCVCDGVCIPRCILYSHYTDFCLTHSLSPACAATFGKIIRQKFPNITTRRLGTRGHSKYHYYGICIKETSQYYQALYSGGGLTRFSGSKFVSEGGYTRKYSLTSRTGSMLPEFPTCYSLNLPSTLSHTKLEMLLVMYRTHCQCILDTVISARFAEVSTYLLNFWQGIPEHFLPLLEDEMVINMLTYCDTILYTALIDALIPATMQEVSEQLLVDIQKLAGTWESWTSHSLSGQPLSLVTSKMTAVQHFTQALRRQATFLQLAQMVRPILYDCQMVNQMNADVNSVQLDIQSPGLADSSLETDFLVQLKEVLHKQATVEAFTEWLDSTLTLRVLKPCNNNNKLFRKKAHAFLVSWSRFGVEFMQALSEQKATSLTSINLLRLLLDEYIMVAIETQIHEQATHDLLSQIQQFVVTSSAGVQELTGSDLPRMNSTGYVGHSYITGSVTRNSTNASKYQSVPENYEDTAGVSGGLAKDLLQSPPVSPSTQQSSCRYTNHHDEWIPSTTTSSYYQWNQPNLYPIGQGTGTTTPFPPVMPPQSLSYEGDYNMGRKDVPAYSYSYTLPHSDPQLREHGYVPNSQFGQTEEAPHQNLPSIGHVFY